MAAKKKEKEFLQWKWTRYTCSFGFVFIIVAVICRIVMPLYVEYKILRNLPLVNGSEAFEGWRDPPVTPTMSLYVFNLTNLEAFLAGTERPHLSEVGPYIYRQHMRKTDVVFSQDGEEVTHTVTKQYYFAREISNGSDTDLVVVPNVPMFGLMKKMKSESDFTKSLTKSLVEGYEDLSFDTTPFISVTVDQMFWGYPSVVLSIARTQSEECAIEEEDAFDYFRVDKKSACDMTSDNMAKFGLFYGRNNTPVDERTVKTGLLNPHEKGVMVAWNNTSILDYWSSEECNIVSGRDPSGLPLKVESKDVLSLFIGQICRLLKFEYLTQVKVDDEFDTLRFAPAQNSFSSRDQVPENQCYCITETCLPSGLLDIGGCQPGSPIYMSWPHFLYGDPQLRKNVVGLKPESDLHEFTIDIMPKYGIALSALARLQMNVVVEKDSGFQWFDSVMNNVTYLPFMWLEEGVVGPSETIKENVRFLQELPLKVANLMALGFFAGAFVLFLPEIILWSKTCI